MTVKQTAGAGALRHRTGVAVSVLAAMVAVACGGGGGGGVAGVGSGGTGFVTGFGSVIVDGVTYEDSALDSNGAVKLEDGANDSVSDRNQLRIGQRLELQLSDDGTAVRSALIASELTGPVTTRAAVGATSFAVAGQTVTINTDPAAGPVTVLEGAAALSDFLVGDRVEVHGDLNAAGTSILASRIERKPSTDANGNAITLVKVSGLLKNLNTAQNGDRTFTVGGLQVNLPASGTVTPAVASLVNDQRVKVFGTLNADNSALQATAVRIKRFNQSLGDFRLRGIVSSQSSATSFVINGIVVDASGVSNLPTIVVNRAYRVRGAFTAPANGGTSGGTLKATEVRSSDDSSVKESELKGSITDFVSASNFRVRGVLVNAGSATVTGGCTLANGQFVEVKGLVSSAGTESNVGASQVKCENSPRSGSELKLTEAVSNLNTSAKTFTLGNQLVNYAASKFDDGSVADLANGAVVEVEGRLSGTTLNAREIEFKSLCGSSCAPGSSGSSQSSREDREVEGRLASDAGASGNGFNFDLSGVQLTCTAAEVGSACSQTSLRKGAEVEARYGQTQRNGRFVVTRLKREDDDD